MSTKSDHFKRYHIPKGAFVMGNLWSVEVPMFNFVKAAETPYRAITRDPEIYDDPQSFRPERYLDGNPIDARDMVFGFGRR